MSPRAKTPTVTGSFTDVPMVFDSVIDPLWDHLATVLAAADTPIEALYDFRSMLDLVQVNLRDRVAAARESGATWAAIGEALGVTRQAAQQQYRDL